MADSKVKAIKHLGGVCYLEEAGWKQRSSTGLATIVPNLRQCPRLARVLASLREGTSTRMRSEAEELRKPEVDRAYKATAMNGVWQTAWKIASDGAPPRQSRRGQGNAGERWMNQNRLAVLLFVSLAYGAMARGDDLLATDISMILYQGRPPRYSDTFDSALNVAAAEATAAVATPMVDGLDWISTQGKTNRSGRTNLVHCARSIQAYMCPFFIVLLYYLHNWQGGIRRMAAPELGHRGTGSPYRYATVFTTHVVTQLVLSRHRCCHHVVTQLVLLRHRCCHPCCHATRVVTPPMLPPMLSHNSCCHATDVATHVVTQLVLSRHRCCHPCCHATRVVSCHATRVVTPPMLPPCCHAAHVATYIVTLTLACNRVCAHFHITLQLLPVPVTARPHQASRHNYIGRRDWDLAGDWLGGGRPRDRESAALL
jgi:hypothetical protein